MYYRIAHTTRYEYDAPLLGECFMEVRLRPLTIEGRQICHDFSLTIDPPASIHSYEQPGEMGTLHHFIIRNDPHESLSIDMEAVVETIVQDPFAEVDLLAEDWSQLNDEGFTEEFAEWLAPTALVPLGRIWAGPAPQTSVFAYAQALSEEIYHAFEYMPGATDISTPLTQFVAQRRGVCQDYAHLMLAVGRAMGIPARYVSGYLCPSSKTTQGIGATHAWVEFYLPQDRLWKGFDPTNNVVVADYHVKVAVGRDYADVPPTKGLLRASRGQRLPASKGLEVDVLVTPLEEPTLEHASAYSLASMVS